VKALRRMGEGATPASALQQATGADLSSLEAALRADLRARLAAYDATSEQRFAAYLQSAADAQHAGNRDRAADLLLQAAKVDPDSPVPWAALARVHAEAGRKQDALLAFDRWAAMDGSSLQAQKAALLAALQAGRLGDARRFAQTVLHIDPDDAEARRALR
ncbi:MAG: hypothetical protein ACRDH5_04720, partial [bacterium]